MQIADKSSEVKIVRSEDGIYDIIGLPAPKSIFAAEGYPDLAEERTPDRPTITPEQQSLYRQDSAVPDILQYLISAERKANDLAKGPVTRSMTKVLSSVPLIPIIDVIDGSSENSIFESNLYDDDKPTVFYDSFTTPEPEMENEEIIDNIYHINPKYDDTEDILVYQHLAASAMYHTALLNQNVARNWDELCQHVSTDEFAII